MVVHSRTIGFFLNSLKDLEAISVQVRRLIAMQQVLATVLPGQLADQSEVVSEQEGRLVLAAPNAAAAAKLRQLSPRMLAALAQQKFYIRSVQVVVRLARRTTVRPAPKRRLGATAMRHFTQLSHSVTDPRLRSALQRLVSRQGGLDGEHQALEGEKSQHDEHEDHRVFEDLPTETQPAPVTGEKEQSE